VLTNGHTLETRSQGDLFRGSHSPPERGLTIQAAGSIVPRG
jgi:hypothetical protein